MEPEKEQIHCNRDNKSECECKDSDKKEGKKYNVTKEDICPAQGSSRRRAHEGEDDDNPMRRQRTKDDTPSEDEAETYTETSTAEDSEEDDECDDENDEEEEEILNDGKGKSIKKFTSLMHIWMKTVGEVKPQEKPNKK